MSMEALNCPRCGRLFTKIRANVCPSCEKAEEETFVKLRAYIEENPSCTLSELAEKTEVSIKRITQFIRDGRLEISRGMHGEIVCTKCGKPILSGRYCDSCITEIGQNVNTMFGKNIDPEESNGKSSNRMFTLGKSKKL